MRGARERQDWWSVLELCEAAPQAAAEARLVPWQPAAEAFVACCHGQDWRGACGLIPALAAQGGRSLGLAAQDHLRSKILEAGWWDGGFSAEGVVLELSWGWLRVSQEGDHRRPVSELWPPERTLRGTAYVTPQELDSYLERGADLTQWRIRELRPNYPRTRSGAPGERSLILIQGEIWVSPK